VATAWPDFDTQLIQFKFKSDSASDTGIQRLLAHHDEPRIAQIAKLLEVAEDSESNELQFQVLLQVCHMIAPDVNDEQPKDDGQDDQVLNHLSTTKGLQKVANLKSRSKKNQATAATAPTSTRVSQSGKRKLPMMPEKLARELHARFTHPRFAHPGKTRLIRSLKLFGWLDRYQHPLEIPVLPVMWRRLANELTLARYAEHTMLVRSGIPISCLRGTLGNIVASDGSKYAAIFTDDKSGRIIALPLGSRSLVK